MVKSSKSPHLYYPLSAICMHVVWSIWLIRSAHEQIPREIKYPFIVDECFDSQIVILSKL